MTDETVEDFDLDLTFTNFPPSGDTGEIRTVAFGPVGPMQLLVQIREPDEDNTMKLDIVVSNAAENDSVKEFLAEMIEILQGVVNSIDDHFPGAQVGDVRG